MHVSTQERAPKLIPFQREHIDHTDDLDQASSTCADSKQTSDALPTDAVRIAAEGSNESCSCQAEPWKAQQEEVAFGGMVDRVIFRYL